MLEDLLKPLSPNLQEQYNAYPINNWGFQVCFYNKEEVDFKEFDIALIGVNDDRGTTTNKGCGNAAATVRDRLYKLHCTFDGIKIIDLGDIEAGAEYSDTHFALNSIIYELLSNKIIPVVIGGSHDLTYAQYQAYQKFEKNVNLVVIDERIDLDDFEDNITDLNHLAKILTHKPNFLGDLNLLGYQSYYTSYKAVDTLEKLNFDSYRLGSLRNTIEEAEPLIRDADLLSFDISAIRQSDAPGKADASPNGFFGEEACSMARYAGLSDKLTSFGIYNLNPQHDTNEQTSQLVAQMIWYFAEGYYNRKGDEELLTERDYLKYIVELEEEDHQLIFWKSKKSDRWWVELKIYDVKKNQKPVMIPCSYGDYQQACGGEIPERWIRANEKLGAVI